VTASSEGRTSRVWALTFAPAGSLTGATEISRLADPDAVSATADMRYLVSAGPEAVRTGLCHVALRTQAYTLSTSVVRLEAPVPQ
jgi:hypothetical protein